MNSKISWNLLQFPEIEEWRKCASLCSAKVHNLHNINTLLKLRTAAFDKTNRDCLPSSKWTKLNRTPIFYVFKHFSIVLNFLKLFNFPKISVTNHRTPIFYVFKHFSIFLNFLKLFHFPKISVTNPKFPEIPQIPGRVKKLCRDKAWQKTPGTNSHHFLCACTWSAANCSWHIHRSFLITSGKCHQVHDKNSRLGFVFFLFYGFWHSLQLSHCFPIFMELEFGEIFATCIC